MAHSRNYAPESNSRPQSGHQPDNQAKPPGSTANMSDIIQGPVTLVIDGDTFVMNVTHIGSSNQRQYNASETIRLAGFDAPELPSRAGQQSKESLAQKLSGRSVQCTVQARDIYGRVVATVKVL